jgi:hypothetical protein
VASHSGAVGRATYVPKFKGLNLAAR